MIGYFAQVKHGMFSGWCTIGKHVNGFGDYEEDHLDYPLQTQQQAVTVAHAYADYHKLKKGFTTYSDIML
jgi:hypothetical protein